MWHKSLDTKIYTEICTYYEGLLDYEDLMQRCKQELSNDPYYRDVLRAVKLSTFSSNELDEHLMGLTSDSAFRLELLHLCGFRPREADEILDRRGLFHGSGPNNALSKLSIEDAIRVSAFLEVPIGYLLSAGNRRDLKFGEAWFESVGKVGDWPKWLSEMRQVQKGQRFSFLCSIDMDGGNSPIGLSVWSHEDLRYVSVAVQEPFFPLTSEIQGLLMEAIRFLGWDWNVACFSMSRPFLNTYGRVRIYGLTIWDHRNKKARARLYQRAMSTRVEEVTFLLPSSYTITMKYPGKNTQQAIGLLWDLPST